MPQASPVRPLDRPPDLTQRGGADIRPALLRAMTDLYIQKPEHTDEEAQHFTELALRLIELVDAGTRATIAAKIAGYPTAPAAVRQRLLRELIAVKAPEPEDAHEQALPTTPAPLEELSGLFLSADAEERRLILLNLPYATLAPAEPITAGEAIHRIEAAALGHNHELLAREFERTLSISREHARRLIDDESGEPIVVVAVTLGMPAPVLQRILLCLNPAVSRSVQRVYELALLHEEIEPEAALRLLAIWQSAHPSKKKTSSTTPAHQPVHPQTDRDSAAADMPARPRVRWEEFAQSRKDSA